MLKSYPSFSFGYKPAPINEIKKVPGPGAYSVNVENGLSKASKLIFSNK